MEFHIFTAVLTVTMFIILKYRGYDNENYAISIPILLYSYRFFFANQTSTITLTPSSISSELMLDPYPTSSN